MTPTIVITVDGRAALTTRQLGEEFDLDSGSARTVFRRAGLEPVAHLDERTPLYDAAAGREALSNRPGRGGPGQPRARRVPAAVGVAGEDEVIDRDKIPGGTNVSGGWA